MLTRALTIVVALAAAEFLCNPVVAQEMAPRAYWPSPNGTSIALMSYQKSTGDIVTDPSLPLLGVARPA